VAFLMYAQDYDETLPSYRLASSSPGCQINWWNQITPYVKNNQIFTCPSVAHPTAFIEASTSLQAGVQVFPHAYVGSEAEIGFGAIINTDASYHTTAG
jgi:UDP-3-O-[3-hydroxymyristoyl] glucosamine N-acyltransferase